MVELADVAGAEYAFARHEHMELRTGLDQMHSAARAFTRMTDADGARLIGPLRDWLANVLLPHFAWEGTVIFPEIDELSTTTWPTRLMRFDHVQISRAARLAEVNIDHICMGEATSEERHDVHDMLVGLETLIRSHLEREDAFLLPILDGRFIH
jgi:hemerythrin-like domain-containing protein